MHFLIYTVYHSRANRPMKEKDKRFSFIIDSIGLLEHLSETLELYNLLADNNIHKDFQEDLFVNIERKVEEFEELFKDIKQRLKNFKLGYRCLYRYLYA